VQGRLLLDVVVRKGAPVLELLAGKDETLLIGGNALLVLDLGLDVVNGVRRLDIEGDGLAGQGLDEDLHAATETQDKVQGRLLLDVVVRKGAPVLELLAGKDETLLIGGNALLVLDLGLDVVNGVRRLDIEGDGLAGQGLDEDLHAATKSEDEVEGGLLLDVVVGESSAVLELLAREDQSLLVRRDALLVLDLGLDVLDGVALLNLEGDGLAGQGLDEDLHAAAQTEHQVKGGLLLDVVVRQGAAILQLLAGEDEALLVGRDALLVLDFLFHVVDRVRGFHVQGDGLARKSFNEDLHLVC